LCDFISLIIGVTICNGFDLSLHQYIQVRWYPSFFDMLEVENLGDVLPGVESG